MKRGFTLLELIIVIIILGVLATLGFTQYVKVVEKGRSAEAKAILGDIRTGQMAYHLENNAFATSLDYLPVSAPTSATNTHYFIYAATGTNATATRLTTGGKPPTGQVAYTISIDYSAGTFGGSAGYY